MEQTAVEWLMDKLFDPTFDSGKQIDWFEHAKEMEKQQILEAFKRGTINEMNGIEEITSEQYYNETFNK